VKVEVCCDVDPGPWHDLLRRSPHSSIYQTSAWAASLQEYLCLTTCAAATLLKKVARRYSWTSGPVLFTDEEPEAGLAAGLLTEDEIFPISDARVGVHKFGEIFGQPHWIEAFTTAKQPFSCRSGYCRRTSILPVCPPCSIRSISGSNASRVTSRANIADGSSVHSVAIRSQMRWRSSGGI
jgi:hypothetical protein